MTVEVSVLQLEDVAEAIECKLQAFAQLAGMDGVRTDDAVFDDDDDLVRGVPITATVTTFGNVHYFWAVWIPGSGPLVLDNSSLDAESGYESLTEQRPYRTYTDSDFF